MAGDGPISDASIRSSSFNNGLSVEFLRVTRAVDRSLYDALWKLCERIETLSTSKAQFLLHPSKCRCLLQSYRLLLQRRFFNDRISSRSVPSGLIRPLIRVVLHTLQDGVRFVQDCTFRSEWTDFITPAGRVQWLVSKALPIVLSTEILDVHLHDFVGCISPLVRMACVGFSDERYRLHMLSLEDNLIRIWASADDEHDAQRMQYLYTNPKAKELQEICRLICRRLSESTSKSQLNSADATVPTYLWMDPPGFDSEMKKIPAMLSSHRPQVLSMKLMGGKFACKLFQCSASEEEFTNEAVVQASLRHANVMHLLWCTRREGSRSLVMELMDENLYQVIERRKGQPFSLLAGINIILQVAKGMKYLHDLGIMHRDLKSLNILVRGSEDAENGKPLSVKVADFGSSKVKHNSSLFTTKPVGTLFWRAPEVMDSEDETKYTKKADVYSFAIVCTEILTGLPPNELLPCERMSELPRVVKEGRRPRLPSSCPPAIAKYIEKCWDGDASRRPTFKQICRVFACFRACLLSGEREVLESSLPHIFDCERLDFQAVKAARGFPGRLMYHPVLGMLSEMDHMVRLAEREVCLQQQRAQYMLFPLHRVLRELQELMIKQVAKLRFSMQLRELQKMLVERRGFSLQLEQLQKMLAKMGFSMQLVQLQEMLDERLNTQQLKEVSMQLAKKGVFLQLGQLQEIAELIEGKNSLHLSQVEDMLQWLLVMEVEILTVIHLHPHPKLLTLFEKGFWLQLGQVQEVLNEMQSIPQLRKLIKAQSSLQLRELRHTWREVPSLRLMRIMGERIVKQLIKAQSSLHLRQLRHMWREALNLRLMRIMGERIVKQGRAWQKRRLQEMLAKGRGSLQLGHLQEMLP